MELHDSFPTAFFFFRLIVTTFKIGQARPVSFIYKCMLKKGKSLFHSWGGGARNRLRGWLTQGHEGRDRAGARTQILELPSFAHSGVWLRPGEARTSLCLLPVTKESKGLGEGRGTWARVRGLVSHSCGPVSITRLWQDFQRGKEKEAEWNLGRGHWILVLKYLQW